MSSYCRTLFDAEVWTPPFVVDGVLVGINISQLCCIRHSGNRRNKVLGKTLVLFVAQLATVCVSTFLYLDRPMTAPISDGSSLPRKSLC